MPEKIGEIEDLKREGITLKEEDIMKPEPSSEQVALWEEIEKNITEKILERDNLFGSLSKDIRNSLTSEYTSNKLKEISQKHNLAQDQIIALSHYIKSLFITLRREEEFDILRLINLLSSDLDIDLEKAQFVFQDINNEILLPALKTVPSEKEQTKQSPPTKPPTTPKPKNERIVDLKNLPNQ